MAAAPILTRSSPGRGSTTGTSMVSIDAGPDGTRTTARRDIICFIVICSFVGVMWGGFAIAVEQHHRANSWRISDKWVALVLAALGGDCPRPGAATYELTDLGRSLQKVMRESRNGRRGMGEIGRASWRDRVCKYV